SACHPGGLRASAGTSHALPPDRGETQEPAVPGSVGTAVAPLTLATLRGLRPGEGTSAPRHNRRTIRGTIGGVHHRTARPTPTGASPVRRRTRQARAMVPEESEGG